MPIAAAGFLAASARARSLVTALLIAYLSLVVLTVGAVLVLSPFREVGRGGLAVVEALALGGSVGAWLARGRPGLPLAGVRAAARQLLVRPETSIFAAAVVLLLAY